MAGLSFFFSSSVLTDVFTLHFALSICALYGNWNIQAYMIYNVLFTVLLFLSLNHKPAFLNLAIRLNLLLIIFDCLLFYEAFNDNRLRKARWEIYFSFTSAALNCALRFFSTPIMMKVCYDESKKLKRGDSKSDDVQNT